MTRTRNQDLANRSGFLSPYSEIIFAHNTGTNTFRNGVPKFLLHDLIYLGFLFLQSQRSMGSCPSKSKGTISSATLPPPPPPPWAALRPKLVLLIFRRLSSNADRVSFVSVCRQWRHIAKRLMRWSDLPPKIADLVLHHLSDEADRVRFGAVCRHWHDVTVKFRSPWSGLPSDLACLILHRLVYSHTDRVIFAAVCRHWRHVAGHCAPALPPALPWLWIGHGMCQSLPDCKVHNLRLRGRKVCLGPFGNWLLFTEFDVNWFRSREADWSYRFPELANPLSGAKLSLPTHCNEPVSLDSNGSLGPPSNLRTTCFDIHKVILCTGDLIAAMGRYRGRPKTVVCCRKGMLSWSTGLWDIAIPYQDMAFHASKLYAVANGGDLFLHEVSEDSETREPKISRIERVIRAAPEIVDGYYSVSNEPETRCYLVISITGKLLLVRWFIPYGYSFEDTARRLTLKVFEADFERSLWVQVERMDDQVLFVSSRASKAMSVSLDCDYLQGNKIYVIHQDVLFQYFSTEHRSCTCVYDMCSKIIEPIFQAERMCSHMKTAWFFP